MFFHDGSQLQYHVRVDKPSPFFAKMLQQAIGGVEGEIRVALQYLFQSWGNRGPKKYRDMLLETGTEELAHIEMLATAVALNLEGAGSEVQEAAARQNPTVAAILGGMSPRQYLSAGFAALPADAEGVPFNASHVYASGNVAADMLANATAEATGRALACRLYAMTDDPGMKDMLSFLIARDTMHQQQWLAVIEELGGYPATLPIPNSFPESNQVQEVAYAFIGTHISGQVQVAGRFTEGASLDGKGQFHAEFAQPIGGPAQLGPPAPTGFAQAEQMLGATPGTPNAGNAAAIGEAAAVAPTAI